MNFVKWLHKDKQGLTLLELIIVMALISIAILMAYSLNIFGLKVFGRGESKSNVQFDARMAMDYITKEVRYSSEVTLLPDNTSIPATVANEDKYIYLEASGSSKVIKYKDKTGSRTISSFTSGYLNFTSPTNKTLKFDIDGTYKGENFEINSDVIPLNMKQDKIVTNSTGIAIRYKKEATIIDDALIFKNAPPNVKVGTTYSFTYVVTDKNNITSTYTYSIVGGSLPNGLALSSSGVISGKPTVVGSFSFEIKVIDTKNIAKISTRSFTMLIGDSALTAANVASKIPGTYPFPDPAAGDSTLVLPTVPFGFTVIINYSSNTSVVSVNGDIYPQLSATNVAIRLTVIDLINGVTANTADITKIIPARPLDSPPVASNVTISGTPSFGSLLTGNYTYSDYDHDTEGISVLKWYRSSYPTGVKTYITTGKTYRCQTTDIDKYIFFEVTPMQILNSLKGQAVMSDPVIIENNQIPVVTVRITRDDNPVTTVNENDNLNIDIQYFDAEGDNAYIITQYKWIRKASINANPKDLGINQNHYTVDPNDAGKLLYVQITLHALEGNTSPITVESANVKVN